MKKVLSILLLTVFVCPQISYSKGNVSFELLREQLKVDIDELDEMSMEMLRIYGKKYKNNCEIGNRVFKVIQHAIDSRNKCISLDYILKKEYTIKDNYKYEFYLHLYDSLKEYVEFKNNTLRKIHPNVPDQNIQYLIDIHTDKTAELLQKYHPQIIFNKNN